MQKLKQTKLKLCKEVYTIIKHARSIKIEWSLCVSFERYVILVDRIIWSLM